MNKKNPSLLKNIKLFAMDVDGTLTDGHIYMGDNGELFKAFHVKDGLGIKLLMANDIIPAIITGRTSEIVANRAIELGMKEVHQGIKNKAAKLEELMAKYNLSPDEVAYIGDDMNDLSAVKTAGITFAPNDCAYHLREYIDFILSHDSGNAPVREAIDMILNARGITFEGFFDL